MVKCEKKLWFTLDLDNDFGLCILLGSPDDTVGRLLTPAEGCGFQPPEKMFLMDYYRMFQ